MRYALALSVVLGLFVTACGSSSPTSPNSSTVPNLIVSLKDSPFSDAKALLVTFSAVTAHRTAGDFSTLPFSESASSRTCDLKRLTSATDVLGTGALPTGHYTMLRLVVSNAAIYFDNPSSGAACAPTMTAPAGRSAAVNIPSGEVRLNREFDLAATNATTILLDFDGDQSVRQTGNDQFMMTPVIGIVSVQ